MGASRRVVTVAAVAAWTLAACDVLLGLDKYQDVACAFDCAADTGPRPDVHDATPLPDVLEVGSDGEGGLGPDADAGADVADAHDAGVVAYDGGPVAPTAHEVWAHWPMPNPDAAIAPDASTLLPHAMTYDAGIDGGAAIVYDAVTKLSWARTAAANVSSIDQATSACAAAAATLGGAWRVPTRIELVSLIDFTQPSGQPTIDPVAFPDTPAAPYWTSSAVPGDGGPSGYWSVSFATGLAANTAPAATTVRCVSGGTP
jgi:hypothetical protein